MTAEKLVMNGRRRTDDRTSGKLGHCRTEYAVRLIMLFRTATVDDGTQLRRCVRGQFTLHSRPTQGLYGTFL